MHTTRAVAQVQLTLTTTGWNPVQEITQGLCGLPDTDEYPSVCSSQSQPLLPMSLHALFTPQVTKAASSKALPGRRLGHPRDLTPFSHWQSQCWPSTSRSVVTNPSFGFSSPSPDHFFFTFRNLSVCRDVPKNETVNYHTVKRQKMASTSRLGYKNPLCQGRKGNHL